MAGLFLVALAWKLSCLWRLVHSPIFATHLSADAAAYWYWAQSLSQHGFVGRNPFFLGPVYPYALAFFGLAAGPSIVPALIVQCVLGAATAVLIAHAARGLCRPGYALAAGVLAAGFAMGTFMDISLLMESLVWSLGAGLLALHLGRAAERPSLALAIGSGALIGMMTLGRASFAALLGVLWLVWRIRHGARRATELAGVAAIVVALCCTPVLVRHLYLGHGWIPATYSAGYNAYVGNGPKANGTFVPVLEDFMSDRTPPRMVDGGMDSDGRDYLLRTYHVRLGAAASSNYWFAMAWRAVREQPGNWLRRELYKLALSLNHVECTQISSVYVEELVLGPLGLPFLGGFGFIALLGSVGLLSLRRADARALLVGFGLVALLTMLAFFVVDRYRHHLVLPFVVACGPGLESLATALRTPGAWRRLGLGKALVFAVLAAFVWWPLLPLWHVEARVQASLAKAEALLGAGRNAEAIPEFERAIVASASADARALFSSSAACRNLDHACVALAELHAEAGDLDRSQAALMRAIEVQPTDTTAAIDLAALFAIRGEIPDAVRFLADRGVDTGSLESALLRWAGRFEAASRWPLMESALRSTVAIDSTNEIANVVLLRLLSMQGRRGEATALLGMLERRNVPRAVIAREAEALRTASR